MPWVAERNPYYVWLSEIILQQTRVEQGMPYFERFRTTYPTVADLAAAPDDDVMKLWEGLGYYSRARNLLAAARQVVNAYGGSFPDTYEGLLGLPGVGPYTAAAIASFAFDRPTPVLDGNVYRVLSRYADDATPADESRSRRYYTERVTEALGDASARRFNQAIMDFGALVCTPKRADCPRCPLHTDCQALASGTVYERPVKTKKTKRRDRFFHYLILLDADEQTLIRQRGPGDVWQDLYEFPLLETKSLEIREFDLLEGLPMALRVTATDEQGANAGVEVGEIRAGVTNIQSSQPYRHQLSHQSIAVQFHRLRLSTPLLHPPPGHQIVPYTDLRTYAFARVITRYLEEGDRSPTLF